MRAQEYDQFMQLCSIGAMGLAAACAGCIRYTTINAVNRYLPETLSELASRELAGACCAYEDHLELISKVC